MELSYDRNSPVPPLSEIIRSLGDNQNMYFYKAANFLHFNSNLNPLYTLVSIRELILMSPINYKKCKESKNYSPLSSYKWLYLLYAISSNRIQESDELEAAKNEFVLKSLLDFIVNVSEDIDNVVLFDIGIICLLCRLIDCGMKITEKISLKKVYEKFLSLIKIDEPKTTVIHLDEFPSPEFFTFLSPFSVEYLQSNDLFQDAGLMLKSSILRFLYRVVKDNKPENIEEFKEFTQKLSLEGISSDIAKRTLVQLFDGDEDASNVYNDTKQYSALTSEINQYSIESDCFNVLLPYKSLIQLSNNLKTIISLAELRPNNWISFIQSNKETSKNFIDILTSEYDVNLVISSAILLKIGKSTFEDYTQPFNLFISSNFHELRKRLSELFLEQPEKIAPYVCKFFPLVCSYGSRSSVFFDFLAELIPKLKSSKEIFDSLINTLKSELFSVQNHQNANLYSQLSTTIEMPGSYLDLSPCNACNNPEILPSKFKIDEVQSACKYTHDTILVKLNNPLLISNFSLALTIKKKTRIPRVVKVYISDVDFVDPNELHNDLNWKHVSNLKFSKDSNYSSISFPLQLYTTAIKFHFSEFWEHPDSFSLRCPQCNSLIPDKRSGLCPKCHENAYHCKGCRHINYNHLDGFICSECGFSNFCKFDWTIQAARSFSNTHIKSDSDVDKSLEKCDELMSNAHDIFENINKIRKNIEDVFSPTNSTPMNEKVLLLNSLYNEKCRDYFQQLTTIVQHVSAIRNSVSAYLNLVGNHEFIQDKNVCYHCHATFIREGLSFLSKVATIPDIENLDVTSFLFSLLDNPIFYSTSIGSLVVFCKVNPELAQKVVLLFKESLPLPSPKMVKLLCDITKIDDEFKIQRLKIIASAITCATDYIKANGSLSENILHPLVTAVLNSSLIVKNQNVYCQLHVCNLWKPKFGKLIDPLDIVSLETLKVLLIDCKSNSIQETVVNFLIEISEVSNHHFKKVSDFVKKIIFTNDSFSNNLEQICKILSVILKEPKKFHSALINGLFDQIIYLLSKETKKVVSLERSLYLDLSVGFPVYLLSNLLSVFFSEDATVNYILHKKINLIKELITNFFQLRCLIIQRSKYLKDVGETLFNYIKILMKKELVLDDNLIITNEIGPKIFILTAVESIKFGYLGAVREINRIIYPKPELLNFPIITRKIRTQEDYIPGRLPKEPRMSKTIGPLMRDIKTKICTDLGMMDIIEDDNGMELLVDGNIISLDLSVDSVYKHIWNPNHGDTPMIVICRLQGLDGEATEPMISSFPQEESDKTDPEVMFSYTSILAENHVLGKIFEPLQKESSPTFIYEFVHLLEAVSSLKINMKEMLKLGAIDTLFQTLKKLVEYDIKADLFNDFIVLLSKFIHEDPTSDKHPGEHIDFVFKLFFSNLVQENPNLLQPVLSLIPLLASNSQELMEKVLKFFTDGFKNSTEQNTEFYRNCSNLHLLNGFAEFNLAIPCNESGNKIRDIIFQEDFLNDGIDYLFELFPMSESRNSKKWIEGTENIVLPALLKIIAGIISTHPQSQKLFMDKGAIQLIIQLETITSKASIGELATLIHERAMIEPSIISKEFTKIQEQQIQEAKAKAKAEREKAIKSFSVISPKISQLLDQIEDTNGWECCICKEGYDYLPDELLGFYVYESKINNFSVTSTHFVCVHHKCHRQDISSGRLNEWEAATVRNCERPCNSILPIPSSTMPISTYIEGIQKFYSNISRTSDPMHFIFNDLKFHLLNLGSKRTEITKGGGSFINTIGLFPFLIYSGNWFLDNPRNKFTRDYAEKRIETILIKKDCVADIFPLSLLVLSIEEWDAIKLITLQMYIEQENISIDDLNKEEFSQKLKEILILYTIVDDMNRMSKKPSGIEPCFSSDGNITVRNHKSEQWIMEFIDSVSNESYGICEKWKRFAEDFENNIINNKDSLTVLINPINQLIKKQGSQLSMLISIFDKMLK